MSDRKEFADNIRNRIRVLESEIAELADELRRILQPRLTPVPGPDEEPNDK
jgi:hypothetical protein